MDDYKTQLAQKLEASRKRVRQGREMKALKESAPTLFEIIDGEISLAVNQMTDSKPLSYEEYLSKHGEVRGIMRIRNLIDAKEVEEVAAAQEVEAINGALKNIETNEKQK